MIKQRTDVIAALCDKLAGIDNARLAYLLNPRLDISISSRLPEGETQRYSDGKRLAETHIECDMIAKESPLSSDEEFNNGYWDRIAQERKKLQNQLDLLTA